MDAPSTNDLELTSCPQILRGCDILGALRLLSVDKVPIYTGSSAIRFGCYPHKGAQTMAHGQGSKEDLGIE